MGLVVLVVNVGAVREVQRREWMPMLGGTMCVLGWLLPGGVQRKTKENEIKSGSGSLLFDAAKKLVKLIATEESCC